MKNKLIQLFVTLLFIVLLLIPIIQLQKVNEQLVLYNNSLNAVIEERNNTINELKEINNNLKRKLSELDKTTQQEESLTSTKNLGEFKITAYCNCSKCCGKWSGGPTASGVMPKAGRTIAVDPKVIPLGTKVIIDGDDKIYIAEDTGGSIKNNRIDVFFSSHSEALSWGVKYKNVSIIK